MNKTTTQPREFWLKLEHNQDYVWTMKPINYEVCIHAIEASAYIELQAELEQVKTENLKAKEDWLKMREELAPEKARSAKLVEALKQVDRHWFDGSLQVNKGLACWACMCCDMGDAGRKQNADLHDSDCAITIAHEALAEYEASK